VEGDDLTSNLPSVNERRRFGPRKYNNVSSRVHGH